MLEYISKADLLMRGWTIDSIRKFLGEPDKKAIRTSNLNQSYLYSFERVVAVEHSDRYTEWSAWASLYKQDNKKTVEDTAQAVVDYVSNLSIVLAHYDDLTLKINAVAHFNERLYDNYSGSTPLTEASINDPDFFLNRICVNYLRHCCTSYDIQLITRFQRLGSKYGRKLLKIKVLNTIAEIYPQLRKECNKQIERTELWQRKLNAEAASI